MKKFLSLMLALTMLLTLCSAASADAGVFTGVGDSEIGGKGAIEVSVTVDENGAVTAIEVTKNGDTAGISDPAVAQIPGLIVEQQTANVDAVAGATKTSDAIMAAVLDAVTKAGLDTVKWSTKVEAVVEKAEDVTIETEIVVIGGGGAGLAAAVQANQLGSKVLVLEKMGKVGGNTILAGGALNAVNDRSEQAIAYNDSVEWHYTQTLSGGDYQGDPLLVHTLVSNAWDGVQWLIAVPFGIGAFLMGGLYSSTVVAGVHHMYTIIDLGQLSEYGVTHWLPLASAANMAQGAACLAVGLKSRGNQKMRSLAFPAALSCMMGITEPAIFGVNLRYIKVFICGSIGGACGALMTSIFHLGATATGVTGIFAILLHLNHPIQYIVSMLVAMGVAFILTWLFGYKAEKPAAEKAVSKA